MFNFKDMFQNLGAMKEQMDQIRERVGRLKISGESGAGMVRVTVTGEGTVLDINLDPELLNLPSKAMTEELIVSAVNDAMKKSREALAHEMKQLTGGLPIPGLEKLFGG